MRLVLENVWGDVAFDGGASLKVPRLNSVGGVFAVVKVSESNITLPLKRIGQGLTIKSCSNLATLSLNDLTTIGGRTTIDATYSLTSLNLKSLTTLEGDFELNAHHLQKLILNSQLTNSHITMISADTDCLRMYDVYAGALPSLMCVPTEYTSRSTSELTIVDA
ncbi:hypothetical protein DSO57_1010438 [Entomophthora muscae]|uniref:Uncharacterized protein n=1 Tax=Entomophthora muscae TaxID=34485 RepID=A0ACC2RXR4_9FUNG|nr:hypothetical protein DSO57_1010438 [Entomophthora muscae]